MRLYGLYCGYGLEEPYGMRQFHRSCCGFWPPFSGPLSTSFCCHAFTLPSSCWLQHSSACSERFQIINQAENNSLLFVAIFTVLSDGKRIEMSFKASSTITTVSSQPHQKFNFKLSFIDLQRATHCSI